MISFSAMNIWWTAGRFSLCCWLNHGMLCDIRLCFSLVIWDNELRQEFFSQTTTTKNKKTPNFPGSHIQRWGTKWLMILFVPKSGNTFHEIKANIKQEDPSSLSLLKFALRDDKVTFSHGVKWRSPLTCVERNFYLWTKGGRLLTVSDVLLETMS